MSGASRAAAWLRLCWLLPVLMLAANALAWLRWGTDFPFFDDWRAYAAGNIGSFSAERLFQVVNNTMSPVGFALDALAQRWLDGNAVAYQLLSMLAVLGGLLWLQWRLLGWAVANPWVRGAAFVFTVLMLQTGSYWGEQNLAYHQALPLLFLLGALHVIWVGALGPAAMILAVALLGLLAGLSYISGALAGAVMGAVLLLLSLVARGDQVPRARGRWGGVALLTVGGLTTVLQYGVTRLRPSDDPARHFPLRWPWETDFWAFMLGKIGRSFGPGFADPRWELLFALALAALLVGVLLVLLLRLLQGRGQASARLAHVYLPLAAVVFVYLGLVSLGRAGLRDASIQGAFEVFQFAYQRFHFFWATVLLPWAVAGLMLLSARGGAEAGTRTRAGGVVVAVIVLLAGLLLSALRGVLDVGSYYERGARERAATIRCMSEQLGSGQPIMCPEFTLPGWTDWTPAYLHAHEIGASFVKYFPLIPRGEPASWLYQWRSPPRQAVASWTDAEALEGDWRQGRADPQLLLTGLDAAASARCRLLEVRVRLRSARADHAQVFYQVPGSVGFSEPSSQTRPLPPSAGQAADLRFMLDSARGFAPTLRLDPVRGDTRFLLEDLRVACRLAAP